MEKILLINPSHSFRAKTHRSSVQGSIGLPLGILYVAAALEAKGCRVRVLDCLTAPRAEAWDSNDKVYYGLVPQLLRREIEEFKPDIVGISSQFATQEENVLATAELVKDVDASISVVVGGANVSCRAHRFLENRSIDIAARTEGEEITGELIEYFRGERRLDQVGGIAFRQGDGILESEDHARLEDIDRIPFPAYHLIDMNCYLTLYKKGIYTRDRDVKRNMSMITSRGCPYRCVFCSVSQSMGKAWRPHSADYVARHIRYVSDAYKVGHIHFEDDNLMFDLDRFLKFVDVLAERSVTWDTPNGIRVNLAITEAILKKFKRSGCKSLSMGVESGDQEVLNHIVRKGIRLPDVEEFARRCRNVDLPLRAFFILGFPGETLGNMRKTVDFALHLMDDYGVEVINLIATPIYGTELYALCESKGYLARPVTPQTLSEAFIPDGYGLIGTESFSPADVENMSREFTSKVYRRLLFKIGISHPIKSLKRVGNVYTLTRTIKRLWS